MLDIACGSGYAAGVAAERGAVVAGLDASEALVAIARARTPSADFRVGDMFDLPFRDGQFDVATSFNGIWKGCEDALREARRVVRPGGLVGFSFWGSPKRLGLLPYFAKLPAHVGSLRAPPPWRTRSDSRMERVLALLEHCGERRDY